MGHPPQAVWSYTPRRIVSFLWFARTRINRERAVAIADGAAASRGDPKELTKTLKQLQEP